MALIELGLFFIAYVKTVDRLGSGLIANAHNGGRPFAWDFTVARIGKY